MSDPVTNEDGSTTVDNGDGTTTTSWPDGTSKVDYADGSSMTTYPNGNVGNVGVDGSRTLNDSSGNALDPASGQPLQPGGAAPVVEPVSVSVEDVENGIHVISTLAEAAAILADAEAVLAYIEPFNAILVPISLALNLWHALESGTRAYGTMGYCYGLIYSALDMGDPSYPLGSFSVDSPETIATKRTRFAEGVTTAQGQMGDGTNGARLRNNVLLRTAYLHSDPGQTLNEVWKVACTNAGDDFYAAQIALNWPQTGMTQA